MLDPPKRFDRTVGTFDRGIIQDLFHVRAEFADIFLAQRLPFRLLLGSQVTLTRNARQFADAIHFSLLHTITPTVLSLSSPTDAETAAASISLYQLQTSDVLAVPHRRAEGAEV